MEAQTLNCPNCGAAISSDAPLCKYCESKLATVACASCFGMMFKGSKFCPHCGAPSANSAPAPLSILRCPRCSVDMSSITMGHEPMRECDRCGGLWLEVEVFQRITVHREQQSAVLGTASLTIDRPAPITNEEKIRYVPCPQCGQLMNRINFASCSGVVVDVCRGHGTWFDRDELRQIVEFIRDGGMEVSRQKILREIEFQRQQLRAEEHTIILRESSVSPFDHERISGISAARGLLKFLIE